MFCLKIDVVDFFLKNLYSEENLKWKFDFTLHLFAWNADKHGVLRGER